MSETRFTLQQPDADTQQYLWEMSRIPMPVRYQPSIWFSETDFREALPQALTYQIRDALIQLEQQRAPEVDMPPSMHALDETADYRLPPQSVIQSIAVSVSHVLRATWIDDGVLNIETDPDVDRWDTAMMVDRAFREAFGDAADLVRMHVT